MWKPKWFRSKKLPDIPVEFTSHVGRYELIDQIDGRKIILTVHLPSKRVSESHYDSSGVLEKYINCSPMSDQYIEDLCKSVPGLCNMIHTAEAYKKATQDNIRFRRRGIKVIKIILFIIIVWLVVWASLT